MKEVNKEPFMATLNEDQTKAFEALVEFLENPNAQLICLKGFAGTGKTYTIVRCLQYFKTKHKRKKIALTAPTNKAVGVLQKQTPAEAKDILEFATIHKLLGVKISYDEDGNELFKSGNSLDKTISNYDVVVIDEVSMLNDELFHDLLESIDPKNDDNKRFGPSHIAKVIFMGDPKQIPPVGKIDCEPFLRPKFYGIETLELTQIMRQAQESSIVKASISVRENVLAPYIDFTAFNTENEFEVINTAFAENKEVLKQEIKTVFGGEEIKSDSEFAKVIAYRNVQVESWNRIIRSFYHAIPAQDLKQLMKGELIINNKPLVMDRLILLNSNTEMKVVSFKEKAFSTCDHIQTEIWGYEVRVEYYDYDALKVVELDARILREDQKDAHKKILNALSGAAKHCPPNKRKWFWSEFFKSKEFFMDYSYAYAITAHKSQGSTYKKVYVDVSDIIRNQNVEERNRILYTSITRASSFCKAIISK
jgi:ATP-dependent exoDNAse (exonuclease V) alpha subunit